MSLIVKTFTLETQIPWLVSLLSLDFSKSSFKLGAEKGKLCEVVVLVVLEKVLDIRIVLTLFGKLLAPTPFKLIKIRPKHFG